MTYSTTEKETIGLCIALEAVGNIANHTLIELRDVLMYPSEIEVCFHTDAHQEIFIIRLLDFVKERGDSSLTGVSGSCLKVLQSACDTHSFDRDGSIDNLKEAVKKLDDWLNYKTSIELWLSTLHVKADIEVSRLDLIEISGNHCKHNLSRLTGVSRKIHSILDSNGYSVSLEKLPLVLDDFREHLQENYFSYYGTWLVEMLNNIRWGLQNYLQPTFMSSYKVSSYKENKLDNIRYHYEYPDKIMQEIPRLWFWRLMNNIRTGPHLKRFSGTHYLKEQSSIELRNK